MRPRQQKPFIIASTKPCAHCGSAFNHMVCHGSARQDGTPFDLIFQVMCKKCRACGPIAKTAAEAVKGWENRAEPIMDELPPPGLPDVFEEAENEFKAEEKPKAGQQEAQEEILGRRQAFG